MTKEQKLANIIILKDMLKEYDLLAKCNGGIYYDRYIALDMAIKELEQEPCEDCIDKKAIIKYLSDPNKKGDRVIYEDDLDLLPPTQPKPKTGHWIMVSDRTDWYDATFKCSCCGREITMPYESKDNIYKDYPYCHCGAKMESEG